MQFDNQLHIASITCAGIRRTGGFTFDPSSGPPFIAYTSQMPDSPDYRNLDDLLYYHFVYALVDLGTPLCQWSVPTQYMWLCAINVPLPCMVLLSQGTISQLILACRCTHAWLVSTLSTLQALNSGSWFSGYEQDWEREPCCEEHRARQCNCRHQSHHHIIN